MPDGVCVVVLGGGHSADGRRLNERTIERVSHAVSVFHRYGADLMICSGAYSRDLEDIPNKSEAQLMAEEAERAGIPKEAVFREEYSVDTIGNLVMVERVLNRSAEGAGKLIVLVTSDFHMRRVKFLVARIWADRYRIRYSAARSAISISERVVFALRESMLRRNVKRRYRHVPDGASSGFLFGHVISEPHGM